MHVCPSQPPAHTLNDFMALVINKMGLLNADVDASTLATWLCRSNEKGGPHQGRVGWVQHSTRYQR